MEDENVRNSTDLLRSMTIAVYSQFLKDQLKIDGPLLMLLKAFMLNGVSFKQILGALRQAAEWSQNSKEDEEL